MRKIVRNLGIALMLFMLSGASALAVPPLPSSFYGRVTLDGLDASPGVLVSAWIKGVKYAETEVETYEGHSVYAINVPGDDDDTPGVDGGVEGDVVSFRVAGYAAAETAVWHSAVSVEQSISARSSLPGVLWLPLVVR